MQRKSGVQQGLATHEHQQLHRHALCGLDTRFVSMLMLTTVSARVNAALAIPKEARCGLPGVIARCRLLCKPPGEAYSNRASLQRRWRITLLHMLRVNGCLFGQIPEA